MNRAIATLPHAISIRDSGLLLAQHLPVKVLRFSGIELTPEMLRAGRYPLVKTLTFMIRKECLSAEALTLVCFVCSKDGAKVLQTHSDLSGE